MPNYHKNSKWHSANISIYQPDIGELYACLYPEIVSQEFMIKSCHLAAYCQLVNLVCVTSCWSNFCSTSMRLRVVWLHLCRRGNENDSTLKLLTGSSGSSWLVSGEIQHFPINEAHSRIIQMDLKRIIPKTNCPAGERIAALSCVVWLLWQTQSSL